ncbi:MAG TPA: geranylgeranyl reductase family protein [Acidimicrobiales bacterium]|nr:geranylgeranyl reductase family protein [Acidimicrobiales bacterium]
MLDADVAVVGAGPAGSAAAVRLARAGSDVVVLDRARFPRDKCCGDGLTTDALRRLDRLGLDPKTVASWQAVDDIVVRSPSGRVARLPFPRDRGTYAAVAQRRDLDAAVVDLARDAGATILEGCALRGASLADDGIVLEADGLDPISVRYAIGADGMWSPLRKALGQGEEPGYLGEWHAFRQYFGNVGPDAADMWVWFEPDLLPGYAWSFPLPDGRANVGFGVPRQAGRPTGEMAAVWSGLVDRSPLRAVLGPAAEPESPHRAWPIPARVTTSPLTAAGGRVLFAGDAARATDPMTGEGIAQALETAALAADAILAGRAEDPAEVASRYRRDVSRNLAPNHHLSNALSHVLRHRKGARGAVRVVGATDWTRRSFARWLFEDYPRAAPITPWRWERGLLSGSGAFR